MSITAALCRVVVAVLGLSSVLTAAQYTNFNASYPTADPSTWYCAAAGGYVSNCTAGCCGPGSQDMYRMIDGDTSTTWNPKGDGNTYYTVWLSYADPISPSAFYIAQQDAAHATQSISMGYSTGPGSTCTYVSLGINPNGAQLNGSRFYSPFTTSIWSQTWCFSLNPAAGAQLLVSEIGMATRTCAAGSYYTGSTCALCDAGWFCKGDGLANRCPPGTYSSSGKSACTACAAGLNSSAGSSACSSTYAPVFFVTDAMCQIRKVNLTNSAVTSVGQTSVSAIYNPSCVSAYIPNSNYLLIQSDFALYKMSLSTGFFAIIAGGTTLNSGSITAGGIGGTAKFRAITSMDISPDGTYALISTQGGLVQFFLSTSSAILLTSDAASGSSDGIGQQIQMAAAGSDIKIHPSGTYALFVDFSSSCIRKVDLTTYPVVSSTFAGNRMIGFKDGDATSIAQFYLPSAGAFYKDGSLFMVYDKGNSAIRSISLSTMMVSTLTLLTPSSNVARLFPIPGTNDTLIVATNIINRFNLYTKTLTFVAGSTLKSNIQDGVGDTAAFQYAIGGIYLPCQIGGYGYDSTGACSQCPRGTVGLGNGACIVCGKGFTSPPGSNACICSLCDAGTYTSVACNGLVAATCVPCVAGLSFSPTANASACTACARCAPGLYMTVNCTTTSDTVCAICPAGNFCPNATSVLPCSVGSTCPAGSTNQSLCAAGSVCPSPSQSITCSAGSLCLSGSTAEIDCPVGFVCATPATKVPCVSPNYCPLRSTRQLPCPAGFWCANASTIAACPASRYFCVQGVTQPSACSVCAVGQYVASACNTTQDTVCQPCVGPPLPNSIFSGVGSAPDNCPWVCSPGLYYTGLVCAPCPPDSWCSSNLRNTCPIYSTSAPASATQNDCLCRPGYLGDGSATGTSPCTLCPAGRICPGGNSNASAACPANFTSPPGSASSVACECLPGYLRVSNAVCLLCAPGQLCSNGTLEGTCPLNSMAPAGSSASTDCVCVPGYYGSGLACSPCPQNAYCPGGSQSVPCTAHAISPAQSTGPEACYCDRGYAGVANAPCQPCPPGTWCWTGVMNRCPANSTSPVLSSWWLNCTCDQGHSGPDGGPCAPCMPGSYKPATGNGSCLQCSANDYCPMASVVPVPCPPDTPNSPTGASNLTQCQTDYDFYTDMCPSLINCTCDPCPPPSGANRLAPGVVAAVLAVLLSTICMARDEAPRPTY